MSLVRNATLRDELLFYDKRKATLSMPVLQGGGRCLDYTITRSNDPAGCILLAIKTKME